MAEENSELSNEREKAQEEIQVLTAQVNAYSREVDKQKGLVTQSQEKHRTEVYTFTITCTYIYMYSYIISNRSVH